MKDLFDVFATKSRQPPRPLNSILFVFAIMMDQTMYAQARENSEHLMLSNSNINHSGSDGNPEPSDPKGSEKPTRRRSHRPRGCRGGSNRRKNYSGELKSKNCYKNTTNRGVARNKPFFKSPKSNYNKSNHHHLNGGKGRQVTLLVNAQPSTESMLPESEMFSGAGSYDVTSRSNPDYNSSAAWSNQDSSKSSSEFDSSTDLSTSSSSDIQRSFSDSSYEEGIPLPHHQSFKPHNRQNNGLILPPLPSTAFQKNDMRHRGPNPYALQPTTHHNVYEQHHQQQSFPMPFHQDSHNFEGSFQGRNENPDTELSVFQACPQPTKNYNYKAERLDKQRQSIAGGSLFCTSPRSFLMGKKTAIPSISS